MNDLAGEAVEPGDYLCEARGRLFRVLETEEQFAKSRVARVSQVGKETNELLRLNGSFRLSRGIKPESLNADILRAFYLDRVKEVKPRLKKELLERKAKFFRRFEKERNARHE